MLRWDRGTARNDALSGQSGELIKSGTEGTSRDPAFGSCHAPSYAIIQSTDLESHNGRVTTMSHLINPLQTNHAPSRRDFLRNLGSGFGSLALASLLDRDGLLGAEDSGYALSPRPAPQRPRAKAVIQLFQNGGVSQMDLFDPKPELTKHNGQPHPEELETFQLGNKNVLLASVFEFEKYGQSGMEFSELMPHIASLADDLCMVRSMYTFHNNHPHAIHMMQSGRIFPGFPTLGGWLCYALGSENENLPGYVVLRDAAGYSTSGKLVWDNGFMPEIYAGTEFASSGTPVHHLQPPNSVLAGARRNDLDLLADLNRLHLSDNQGNSELEARIENYELAARMQLEAGRVVDISQETAATRKLYGLDDPVAGNYGSRCLLARRLVEAGVRYVQIFPPLQPSFQPWDNHAAIFPGLKTICPRVDQGSAALIRDLKQRGMLDDVIVMWTGEFGRLPITEGADGRDHNRNAFTLLMAGGGFRPGLTYGATDDFGYAAVEDRVSVHDLHATMLHQLGLDHTRLSYPHHGRQERLTDPEVTGARIMNDLLV